jgi:hypothetical protein
VEEVNASKRASYERISVLSAEVDASSYAYVRKYIMISHLTQYELGVVSMGSEVFEAVQSLT